MAYVQEKCPACGGPLPAASLDWLVCKFCGAELRPAPGAQYHIAPKMEEAPFEPHLPRATITGVRYVLLGKLAAGASSDVLLARRDERITETVVLKIARTRESGARAAREWLITEQLQDTQREGAEHFARLLPLGAHHGALEGTDRVASAFRFRAGFQYTFEHVRAEYPEGVDARAAVWMWKRVLEMLGWLHAGGWAHNAIEPSHLVVHPRDHGVILCGFGSAAAASYSNSGTEGSPMEDVRASARAIAYVLGGDDLPSRVPAPITEVVRAQISRPEEAHVAKQKLDAAAQEAFGPPRFHRFTLSGW